MATQREQAERFGHNAANPKNATHIAEAMSAFQKMLSDAGFELSAVISKAAQRAYQGDSWKRVELEQPKPSQTFGKRR